MTAKSPIKAKRERHSAGQRALDMALRLLTRRDHTRRELEVKLRHRGVGAGDIAGAMARLEELGCLDDAKTAMALVDHLVRKGYGCLRIRYVLGQKGVDDAAMQAALQRCGDDAQQSRYARRALNKKRMRLEREGDPVKRRQMAYRFLAGRGFPAPVIHRVIGDREDDLFQAES
jgi:regulatory protein